MQAVAVVVVCFWLYSMFIFTSIQLFQIIREIQVDVHKSEYSSSLQKCVWFDVKL